MRTFAVRLNPDPRKGRWYSAYPTKEQYKTLYKGAVMNGFHEAANYLEEDRLVRGYLPPRHAVSMRGGERFTLITVTPAGAGGNGDKITGVQVACLYRGPSTGEGLTRLGGPRNTAPITFHYSCSPRLSLLFTKPLPGSRKILLAGGQQWRQGPTKELTQGGIAARVIRAAIVANSVNNAHAKAVLKALTGNGTIDIFGPDSSFDHETLALMDAKGAPKGNKSPAQRMVKTLAYTRNPAVADYAIRKAKGVCGDCKHKAPFIRRATGQPFLEVHHIHMLNDGGTDTPDNVIALCPNCHRKRHYA